MFVENFVSYVVRKMKRRLWPTPRFHLCQLRLVDFKLVVKFEYFFLDVDECREDSADCYGSLCQDLTPTKRRDPLFTCSCPEGFEIFTNDGHNGFGMVVKYGEDAAEKPGEVRTIGKSCVRVACPNPRPFRNGTVLAPLSQKFFLSRDEVTFQCDPYHAIQTSNGFVFSKTLTCDSSGQWSEPLPYCTQG